MKKEFHNDYDSFKDVADFQNNMWNPGHYIGTGRVPTTVSAPGNALPLAIVYFSAGIIALAFGLFLFFGDATVDSSGFIKSPLGNKILALVTFIGISLFLLVVGVGYLRKAKRYYREKKKLESEAINEDTEDKIWQKTCPKCGDSHDIDFPKCPKCNYKYLD